MLRKLLLVCFVCCFAVTASTDASLYLTPNGTGDGTLLDPLGPDFQGSDPKNPKNDDVEDITGTGPLAEFYKQNVGDASDTGSFAGSYSTTFDDTPSDPADAWISYTGGAVLTGDPLWLTVKDGNHDPIWYIFDISDWDGLMDIHLEDFWPDKGAISHVQINGDAAIPEPASVVIWSLIAVFGVVVYRCRK